MQHNTIEIEFIDHDSKEQFKQLLGINSGPFLEKLFSWPAIKLHGSEIKPIDVFIWADQTHGRLPHLKPSQIVSRSEHRNSLCYRVITADWGLSNKCIKNLAFMFPIRRITLTHYTVGKHVCIRGKNPNGSHRLNCTHGECQKYVLPWIYDLDWRHLPHPIYETHETLNNVIRAQPNTNDFTEEECGRIYHHLIFENTFFATFENPVIKMARTIFEDQVAHMNNAYLFSMVHLDGYAPAPNIQSKIELFRHAQYVDGLYSQPQNRGYHAPPKRVRR